MIALPRHGEAEDGLPSQSATEDASPAAESRHFDLETYRGTVVYLDFWASWCVPCAHSFPWMRTMQERYGPRGFQVVAVDLDRDPDAAEAFLANHEAPFQILHDPEGEMAEAYELEALPMSFIYDRTGQQRVAHAGFRDGDTEELETQIRDLVAEPAPATPGAGS